MDTSKGKLTFRRIYSNYCLIFSLGMRHDAKEISCDPTMHIMSPKLGSGKVTWSKCSRTYLEDFLQ